METVDLSDRGEGRGGPGRREARDVVAIEIKPGRQVTPADTRGLLSLTGMMRQRRPLALWLAFRGECAPRFDSGVEALPVLEVLRRLAAE